ncbi:hypothetical protein [Nonomuraea sp. NPDC002799]
MIEEPASALRRTAYDLRAAVDALAITVTEDRPDGRPGHKFLQDLEDGVGDLAGAAAEICAHADELGEELDPPATARALAGTHRGTIDASRRLRTWLLDAERVAELHRLAGVWGRPWRAWTDVVLAGLGSAGAALDDVEDSLLASWSRLIERTTVAPVPVRLLAPSTIDRERLRT